MKSNSKSPLRNLFRAIVDIRREEVPVAILMFFYFFLVITSFWILKPIKKTIFIGFYKERGIDLLGFVRTASQAELLAKVLNMVVAFAAVAVFTWLSRRYKRERLTLIFSVFFMVCYIIYSPLMADPGHATVWTFYLFGDLFSTLMVATFFVFLNDSVTAGMAKRMYGLIGAGGVIGGAFGSMVVRVWIERVATNVWLWITFAIAAAIIAIGLAAGRLVASGTFAIEEEKIPEMGKASKESAAVEGAKLVFASRYLLSIVAIVGLYEIASTMLDFQFTSTVEHYVPIDRIGAHFSTIYMITNFAAMFVQLVLTSMIMTRLGVGVALLVMPIAILVASAGYLAAPVLWIGSMLNTADNAFSYSINQSAKETLYVPTTREEKYRAKAFIDMFVQRFAKAIAVLLSLLITNLFTDFGSVRWLSIINLSIVALWLLAVRYAGRRFNEKTG